VRPPAEGLFHANGLSYNNPGVRIDNDLLLELKDHARKEHVPLTQVLNRTLRAGLRAANSRASRRQWYRETTYSLGQPRVDLRKALALAAGLEDDQIVRQGAALGEPDRRRPTGVVLDSHGGPGYSSRSSFPEAACTKPMQSLSDHWRTEDEKTA
jgi:hypothetical protein